MNKRRNRLRRKIHRMTNSIMNMEGMYLRWREQQERVWKKEYLESRIMANSTMNTEEISLKWKEQQEREIESILPEIVRILAHSKRSRGKKIKS